ISALHDPTGAAAGVNRVSLGSNRCKRPRKDAGPGPTRPRIETSKDSVEVSGGIEHIRDHRVDGYSRNSVALPHMMPAHAAVCALEHTAKGAGVERARMFRVDPQPRNVAGATIGGS